MISTTEASSKLDDFMGYVTDLRSMIDVSQFDPVEQTDRLEYEPAKIVEFVKRDIAFDLYTGLLRGAAGTLTSRAGNALDQAVLTATLLNNAGYEARIVQGKLSVEQAKELLSQHFRPMAPQQPSADIDEFSRVLKKTGWLQTAPNRLQTAFQSFLVNKLSLADSPLAEYSKQQFNLLRQSLGKKFTKVNEIEDIDRLIVEAQEYFWVEASFDASLQWQAIHPAFLGVPGLTDLKPTKYFSNEVPSDQLHTLEVEVLIECMNGGEIEEHTVAKSNPLPVANLIGRPISFYNVPDSLFGKNSLADVNLTQALTEAKYFAPKLSNVEQQGHFFDYNCNLIDPTAGASNFAALFKTLNDKLHLALGALSPETKAPELLAQKIRFTTEAPGHGPSSYTRYVFDRLGLERRNQSNIPSLNSLQLDDVAPLLQRRSIGVMVGSVNSGKVVDSALANLEKAYPVMANIAAAADGSAPIVKVPQNSSAFENWSGHTALNSVFDRATDLVEEDLRAYRSGPAIVIHSEGLATSLTSIEAMDIVTNPTRVLASTPEGVVIDREAVMLSGIWETVTEGLLLERGGVVQNSIGHLLQHSQSGGEIRVFDSVKGLSTADLPAAAKMRIQHQINQGYTVVAAIGGNKGATAGWWRVNTKNGETLGILPNGTGGEAVKYEVLITLISIGALYYGLYNCYQTYVNQGSWKGKSAYFLCCSASSVLLYMWGGAVGSVAVSLRSATTASDLFAAASWELISSVADPCSFVWAPPEPPDECDPSLGPCAL